MRPNGGSSHSDVTSPAVQPAGGPSAGGAAPDVVVTGRGVVSSVGEGADAFFDALLQRRSGIEDGVGACTEFDPEVAMTAKEARRADRVTHFAVVAAEQAAAEAGLADSGIEPERLGVLIGTGIGGLQTLQDNVQAYLEGGERAVSPLFVPMIMSNAPAGVVAMRLGAHGPASAWPPPAPRAATRSARPCG